MLAQAFLFTLSTFLFYNYSVYTNVQILQEQHGKNSEK